jgi:hydroxymethylglutaryl-CoA synthase
MNVGIVGYGAYIPRWRIMSSSIAEVWGSDRERISSLVGEKAVCSLDEDTATMAVEAGKSALARAGINPKDIGALYIGSESHPYVVKSTSSIVAEALDATPDLTAADLEFACKAGTAGIQMVMGLIGAGRIKYGMAAGSDTAQGRPGDELEYTAASGAASFILGSKGLLARIDDTYSYTTDTPDFWRREGEEFPRHGGRFTGEPAYFTHVISATNGLLEKTGTTIEDYDYFVFHQPNAKFPMKTAKTLGIPAGKIMPGMLVSQIGNTYSAASLLGLAAVLDIARPGEKILVTSFGSGAGSDSFSITATDLITEKRRLAPFVKNMIAVKEYIGYAHYIKFRNKLKGVVK